MKIFTIGFTQKSAQEFFEILSKNKIDCIVDIRLHPDGQLAGFSKREDLRYFLKQLINCEYVHMDQLAPTEVIMKKYHADKDFKSLQQAFIPLLEERSIGTSIDKSLFENHNCCLLCSESLPDKCHRRLVAETLASKWGGVEIVHL